MEGGGGDNLAVAMIDAFSEGLADAAEPLSVAGNPAVGSLFLPAAAGEATSSSFSYLLRAICMSVLSEAFNLPLFVGSTL